MKKFYAIVLAVGFLTMGAIHVNGSANTEFKQPAFNPVPRDLAVKEGQTAIWSFGVLGNPEPTIQVLKDGNAIQLNAKYKLSYRNRIVTFQIIEVYPEDEGEYTFVLTNIVGMASKTVKLKVLDWN
ncbi:immunoglobulin domain-containing protein [Alistipes sp.]|uniref:immunoglobulin domain-containing protein n=1 Tax=Alistipes sp. TaxID=1872444 RepID=UPI003AEF1CFA